MTCNTLEALRSATETDPTVEFCLNNLNRDERESLSRRDGSVRASACLQRCGDCASESFVVVDGRYVAGDPLEIADAVLGSEGVK